MITVDRDPIYVQDGNCYTSAGVTAGIDLALALVEEDLGRPVALKVAQIMVVFLRRAGGQSQFSTTLAAQTRENRPLGDLLAWLPDNIRRNLTVDSHAGLLFLDWDSGDAIQLSGRAEIVWSATELAEYPGAQRLIDVEVDLVRQYSGAIPAPWQLIEPHRLNPPTRAHSRR